MSAHSTPAPRLSVVVPIHDESESLETLHGEVIAAVGAHSGGMELILVDDGSNDGSREHLRKLTAFDRRVRALALDRHCGQSAALDAGLRAARGSIVATLDGDLQNDPADLPRLIARLEHADVVVGVRTRRRDGWLRRVASRIANAFRNRVIGERILDSGCSLRVMRAEYLPELPLYRGMHRFLPTLMRMRGARIEQVAVRHRPRRFGRSKYGITDRLLPGIVDAIAVRWIQSRHVDYRVQELEKDG